MLKLLGITWDHPRGYEGLQLVTDKYNRNNQNIQIEWEKHSLRDFEAHPLPELADKYDLIVLDHPFMGDADKSNCLLDLSQYANELNLDNIKNNVVGPSFQSYEYRGNLWALPIDAASQVGVYRRDLL